MLLMTPLWLRLLRHCCNASITVTASNTVLLLFTRGTATSDTNTTTLDTAALQVHTERTTPATPILLLMLLHCYYNISIHKTYL
jgi:hypothetical protein